MNLSPGQKKFAIVVAAAILGFTFWNDPGEIANWIMGAGHFIGQVKDRFIIFMNAFGD